MSCGPWKPHPPSARRRHGHDYNAPEPHESIEDLLRISNQSGWGETFFWFNRRLPPRNVRVPNVPSHQGSGIAKFWALVGLDAQEWWKLIIDKHNNKPYAVPKGGCFLGDPPIELGKTWKLIRARQRKKGKRGNFLVRLLDDWFCQWGENGGYCVNLIDTTSKISLELIFLNAVVDGFAFKEVSPKLV